MVEKFNVQGANGRDCPVCYRVGSLTGERHGNAPRLTCTGCLTAFRLVWTSDDITPDTLERLSPPAPAIPYALVSPRGRA